MKEIKSLKPVKINKDAWFYPARGRFEFVVYVKGQPTMFNITKSKLRKYLK